MKMKLMEKRIHNMWILSDLLARRQIRESENKQRKEVIIKKVRDKDVPSWVKMKFK
nr:hypothetical protein [Catenibacterium mitsuokai]